MQKLAKEEKDRAKSAAIKALELSEDEWEQLDKFVQLLSVSASYPMFSIPLSLQPQHADQRQQALSSDRYPCLHSAIPALEGLHKVWSTRAKDERYADFSDALQAGADVIAKYYDRTGDTDAYVVSMCTSHFFTCSYSHS